MNAALCVAGGLVVGVILGIHLTEDNARCCRQLEQLVRGDVRERCGPLGSVCEGLGGSLGLFKRSSSLLDLFGVTT